MKALEECHAFEGLHPRLYYQNGSSFYYCCEHHDRLLITVNHGQPPEAGLWCSMRMKTRGYHGLHHKRVNQEDFLIIILLLEGSLFLRHGNSDFLMEPGDAMLTLPGSTTEYVSGPDGHSLYSTVHIRGALLKPILQSSGLDQRKLIHVSLYNELESVISRFDPLTDRSELFNHEENPILCFTILQKLISAAGADSRPGRCQELENFLYCNLDTRLDLEALARHAGCCKATLNKFFRKHFGTSPHKYLRRLRMEIAARLLSESFMSVKEVSVNVGYENPLNFSTEFKKFFGVPPSHYGRRGAPVPGKGAQSTGVEE